MTEIKKNSYRIVIYPSYDEKGWLKEVITLRKASKPLDCNECNWLQAYGRKIRDVFENKKNIEAPIKKGDYYIRDKFYYPDWGYFESKVKTITNFIYLKCWKGPTPGKSTKNWRQEDRERWLKAKRLCHV
jgi:hypothetical protein